MAEIGALKAKKPAATPATIRNIGFLCLSMQSCRSLSITLRIAKKKAVLLLLDAAAGPDGGRVLDSVGIVDIGNLIGKCVVSGDTYAAVRRMLRAAPPRWPLATRATRPSLLWGTTTPDPRLVELPPRK